MKLDAAVLALLPMLAFAKTEVSFLFSYDPGHPEYPETRAILDLARRRPDLTPVKWGGLTLPGAGGRATFMLALAGGTAPDVYKAWFHILRHDVAQGFVYPLDEWVSPPPAGTGDLWDRVRCFDGHVWALPTPGVAYYGLVYRKDIVRAAGLDPESPPRTWSAFRDWCVKLTVPGRRALAVENRPWGFLPWVQSAGGDVIRETGDGAYEACFDSPGAVRAANYLQRLIRLGVVRGLPTLSAADDVALLFTSGEIACVFGGEDLVRRLTETYAFPLEEIGLMPFPGADDGGTPVLQAHRHFYALSESVARRPKEARDLAFACLSALASARLADAEIRRNVAEGRSRWCRPADLRRLGYAAEADALPKGIVRMYEALARGEIRAVTEPWVGF
jgi:multiple sugar transport system substrate-binding protein